MTPTDKNVLIAKWLGWKSCRESKSKPWKCKKPYGEAAWEYVNLPDFYNTNVSFDLLDVLVERGYLVTLEIEIEEPASAWKCRIRKVNWSILTYSRSKSAAICEAIISLIEREKDAT